MESENVEVSSALMLSHRLILTCRSKSKHSQRIQPRLVKRIRTQQSTATNDDDTNSESEDASDTTSVVSDSQLRNDSIDLQAEGSSKPKIDTSRKFLDMIFFKLQEINKDLTIWKTKALVDNSAPEHSEDFATQEPDASANKPTNYARVLEDPSFRGRIHEFALEFDRLLKDFQEEASSIRFETISSDLKKEEAPEPPQTSRRFRPRPPRRFLPPPPPPRFPPSPPPGMFTDVPRQTVWITDPTDQNRPPDFVSLRPRHPNARIIPSVVMPDDAECTLENWQEFLPFRDMKRATPDGIAEFDVQEQILLADIPVSFVLENDYHVFRIGSPYLQQKMREIVDVETYFDVSLYNSHISIRRPFAPIYHHLQDMKSLILEDSSASPSDKNYFMAMYHFFESGPAQKSFQDIRTLINEGLIFYEHLWALFKPGDYVTMKNNFGNYGVFKISSIEWQEDVRSSAVIRHRWFLKTFKIVWTGEKYQKLLRIERFELFKGAKLIRDLPIYPLSHHPEAQKVAQLAKESGRLWKSHCDEDSKVMSYHGKALRLRVSADSSVDTTILDASVVVDRGSLNKVSAYASFNDGELIEEPDIFIESKDLVYGDISAESFSEEDYLISPMSMAVFNLDDNEWYGVDVMKLRARMWRPQAFDRLVFDPAKKTFLRHLASHNLKQRELYSRDAIEGKGKGVVLLLYGPPGVGKTMTAEVLSEWTRKPLLKIHLGKLANHQNWEQALEHTFYTAESWDAIMLIDEAEIVLEKRTFERMTQNSWISVFLRKLEYYQGLIVLTTNLINNIDEAFESRISYPVQFHALSREDRKTIWKDFIEEITMLPAYKRDLLSAVNTWAEADLNGRQIRNVVTMAQNLASSDELGGRLTCAHVEDILNVTLEFSSHNRKSVAKKKKDQFAY